MEVPREDELVYDPHDHSHLYLLDDKPWVLSSADVHTNAEPANRNTAHDQIQHDQCMCFVCFVRFITLNFWQAIFEYATFLITDGILVCLHGGLKWPGSFK